MTKTPDAEVEQFVETALICRDLHCLPQPGGLYDQDYRTMKGISFVLDAIREKERIENERASKKK